MRLALLSVVVLMSCYPLGDRRPIGLCEYSRFASFAVVGRVTSFGLLPHKIVDPVDVEFDVTNAEIAVDQDLVGPTPKDIFIYGSVSLAGMTSQQSQLREANGTPKTGLMFFGLRGGRPYTDTGYIFQAKNGSYSFDDEAFDGGAEVVPEADIAAAINAYRDGETACSTGPEGGAVAAPSDGGAPFFSDAGTP